MAYSSSRSTFAAGSSSTSSTIRQQSGHNAATHQQSTVLALRIESKKAELANLKQLREMSDVLSKQMQALETKIGTLKDGTEAVACVLANWDNVLRAINMASSKTADLKSSTEHSLSQTDSDKAIDRNLPATLVRIPAKQPGSSRS
ncbi:DASH complex subunit DAD2 [Aspergillus clavatus NRRL 1]|uniref:DASH complex subunit DAD2 n=1 Tax=Aspergillus clavatus (strain ATCC 1007 / CBS 513.65 / DSM 816 / NCTC 3887 / NRRL 1 / QM 1276 / 107) TaxID=344612 RepID=A1CQN4_ASPCL|nr:uncharacterized protein ACLA_026770 [Aspergillus clavatus NRRL 1]EAW07955.1 predicted protein [Aspergillus clavatus NRRL 1]